MAPVGQQRQRPGGWRHLSGGRMGGNGHRCQEDFGRPEVGQRDRDRPSEVQQPKVLRPTSRHHQRNDMCRFQRPEQGRHLSGECVSNILCLHVCESKT